MPNPDSPAVAKKRKLQMEVFIKEADFKKGEQKRARLEAEVRELRRKKAQFEAEILQRERELKKHEAEQIAFFNEIKKMKKAINDLK